PEPKNIPGLEVLPSGLEELSRVEDHSSVELRSSYRKMMMPEHPGIKTTAARIVTTACDEGRVCYAKALFYFVRDNFEYVSDPPKGYLENPFEVMLQRGSDCDGMTVLLANLLQGAGVTTRLVFVPGHVFPQVKIDEASRKYQEKDGWITLDPTCKSCDFGEVPLRTWNAEKKDYLYI
ncbi:transglutaminase family protein, partial [Nanoarchaeota archaeon]